ncbi:surfactin synthase thioesterase subunit [Anaerobacterium chartisolvens]|uniref:Surfactin synthase thioesterase subunit n=1 Tax=Anaerobacterium chartisolvens TaxID=1297424 RepID=A0A369BBD7_9FIRM|nr:alpha/beta fold hydrolase [Anaerobacterium chartisolvens]RCX18843.1 surfactin synthase thioesterase subunit [Anaerobacterium chartisolvens]
MKSHLLISLKSSPSASGKLICFPYACGNASMYYRMSQLTGDFLDVFAACMPGHGGRGEAPSSIEEFAEPFIPLIRQEEGPIFILGYSFGGFIAYELVRRLKNEANIAGLILISSPPPNTVKEMDFILDAGDEELYRYTLNCYGFDLNVLTPFEKSNYFATLRNDTSAMRKYEFCREAVSVDTLAILGRQEEEPELVQNFHRWGDYLTCIKYSVIPGTHMLIKSHPEELARELDAFIKEQIGVRI